MRIPSAIVCFALVGIVLPVPIEAADLSPIFPVQPELESHLLDDVLDPEETEVIYQQELYGSASDVLFEYSADSPFVVLVSYPTNSAQDAIIEFNPLDTVRARLEPVENARVAIDLTISPAWSARRSAYLFQVVAAPHAGIDVQTVQLARSSISRKFQAYMNQFWQSEPLLLSRINFLWGYRSAELFLTAVLGFLLLITVIVMLFYSRSGRSIVFVLCIGAVMLYDARFSFDLMSLSIRDAAQFLESGLYGQRGPVEDIVSVLSTEKERSHDLFVALCGDNMEYRLSQLRYALYPVVIEQAEDNFMNATHVVLSDSESLKEGMIVCRENARPGTVVRRLPSGTSIARFTPSP